MDHSDQLKTHTVELAQVRRQSGRDDDQLVRPPFTSEQHRVRRREDHAGLKTT
jgi:hypothetical protein